MPIREAAAGVKLSETWYKLRHTEIGGGYDGSGRIDISRCTSGQPRTMTELSPASLRSIRWTVTLAASLGWFFDAYVITIYALTVPLLAAEFHLATDILSGAIGSKFLFGYTIGTLGFRVSRGMLGVSVVGYGVVTALTALASGIGSLAAFRFLTGLGGGGRAVYRQPLC